MFDPYPTSYRLRTFNNTSREDIYILLKHMVFFGVITLPAGLLAAKAIFYDFGVGVTAFICWFIFSIFTAELIRGHLVSDLIEVQ